MKGKKVLIVTYYWPPSGGAAVQRWLSFANNLAESGWEVFVLTVDKRYATYQLYDESLLGQIDQRVHVITTKTFEPFGLYKSIFGKKSIPKPAFSNETNPSITKKIARFIRGNFFIPDPRRGWKRFALPKALKLIDEHGINNVITAGPPHSTHFIGKEIKKIKVIRWIADFHDLWTDVIYYDMLYHLPIVKKKDLKLEKEILESADIVFTVGEKYKNKLLQKSSKIKSNKVKIIRIGYDEKAFKNQSQSFPEEEFNITYTGSIADFYQPTIFFEALKKVLPKYPLFKVNLNFVGVLSEGIKANIITLGLGNNLNEVGYVSHKESIQYLQRASVLLLVNPVTKDEEMVIPGKLYEYLAAHKPIINITSKSSETSAIIQQCNAGRTFDRKDENQLALYLSLLIENWMATRSLLTTGNETTVSSYSRQKITEDIIELLNQA